MSRTISLLNRFEDPENSSDPQIRALVRTLSELDYSPAPRPEFRSELRAQLVAIAGRVVAEGEPSTTVTPVPAGLDPTEAAIAARTATVTKLEVPIARKRRSVGRPLGLAAACCAVLALGLGGAVWKSRSALPGDSLYGLKRASEGVQLSLTRGDTARGHEYLELATTRVQEAHDLLGHTAAMASGGGVQAGGLSPSTVSLIQSTLRSADSDVRHGSTLLGTEALKSHSTSPLAIMTDWAPSQLTRLTHLATALGSGPAHASTLRSWTLVDSALHRARTLGPQVGANCAAARTDRLGPISCTSTTPHSSPASVGPSSGTHTVTPRRTRTHSGHGTPHPTTSGSGAPGGNGTHRGNGNGNGNGKHPSQTGASTSPPTLPTGVPTTLPVTLPTGVPSSLPSLPVGLGSCGISAQVGPIGVHVGSCPSGG